MSTDIYIEGLSIGQGVNPGLYTTHGYAITPKPVTPAVPNAAGAVVEWHMTVIQSSDELLRAFNLTANVGYSGIFSASAAANFVERSSYSRYRTYVLARCIVGLPAETISDPQIKPEVLTSAKAMTKGEFNKAYGTSCFLGAMRGGYYYGVLEIDSTSSTDQNTISEKVSLSGWGVHADVSIANSLIEVTKNFSKRIFVIRQGGPPTLDNPVDVDTLIKQAVTFPNQVGIAPVPIKGIYQSYDEMQPIEYKQGEGQFTWDERQTDLQILGRRYIKLKQLRNDIQFVIDHYDDYRSGTGVVFNVGGESFVDRPLSSASNITTLQAESDDMSDEVSHKASAIITLDSLNKELSKIISKLDEVAQKADKCKSGKEYKPMPENYISSIPLPTIEGKNKELEGIQQRLDSLEQNSVPIGTIVAFGGPLKSVPKNWMLCNGQQVSVDDGYKPLLDAIRCSWGGDGNPYFRLPDLEGIFLRGVVGTDQNKRDRDPDVESRQSYYNGGNNKNSVGSFQAHGFQVHRHADSGHAHPFAYGTAADLQFVKADNDVHAWRDRGTSRGSTDPASAIIGEPIQSPTTKGLLQVGSDTRPINAYVYWIIRVK